LIKINPQKIKGERFEGYTLDVHTISSVFLGYDGYGHAQFDTQRSELGELLYRLKYKSDKSVLDDIVKMTAAFIKSNWQIAKKVDAIIPVPPSKSGRSFQPVFEIAKGVGSRLQIPVYRNVLTKVEETPELKDIYEYKQRLKLLKNSFAVEDASKTTKKNILLLDDLYRSGATVDAIVRTLFAEGKASKVYVLALTRTRSKL
jgi:competence protein ComFC